MRTFSINNLVVTEFKNDIMLERYGDEKVFRVVLDKEELQFIVEKLEEQNEN